MPVIGIYSWSQYTTPSGIPTPSLYSDTFPNDPAAPDYNPGSHSWVGETFTFNGGAPTAIEIVDDDGDFEDGYVETGAPQTLAQDVVIGGTLYPAGSVVENEFSLVDAGGQEIYVVRINGENVGFSYASGQEPSAGESFTASEGLDGARADNADGASSSSQPYADVICFAAGTRIDTPDGPRRVEVLGPGALVTTMDAGAQPVVWAGVTHVMLSESADNVRPVLIAQGRLGGGMPRSDLVVSPQHRLLIDGTSPGGGDAPCGQRREVFAPAKGLLPLAGIRVMRGLRRVSYVHILLPRHHVISAEGVATESFYPGAMALNAMSTPSRDELFRRCAQAGVDLRNYGPPARPCLRVQEVRRWAQGIKRGSGGDDDQLIACSTPSEIASRSLRSSAFCLAAE